MQSFYTNEFQQLFRDNYAELLVFAAGLVGEGDAEDVVVDVFADLWSRRDTLLVGDRMRNLLFKSVYNKSVNVLHQRKVKASHIVLLDELQSLRMDYLSSSAANPQQLTEAGELQSHLDSAISALPEKCRQVFRLKYQQGMAHRDIAESLEISQRTVESHLYHALSLLRTKLSGLRRSDDHA